MNRISDSKNPNQELSAETYKTSGDNTIPLGNNHNLETESGLKYFEQTPDYLHCKDEDLGETSEEDTSTSTEEEVVSVKLNELVSEGAADSYPPEKKSLNKERCPKHPEGT